MKSFVVTFLHPGCEKWIPSWIKSIETQTDRGFEIILFQDKCDYSVLFQSLNCSITSKRFEDCTTPYEVRLASLNFLKKNYPKSLFILSDIDDLLSSDRVEKTKQFFLTASEAILVANLSTIDASEKLITPSLWSGRLPGSFDETFIFRSNIAGFGNSALLSETIPENLDSYRAEIIAGDWFFFYCLLKDSKKRAATTEESLVLYRQHGENEAGISQLTDARLCHGIEVTLAHFNALNKRYPGGGYDQEVIRTTALKDFIQNPSNRLKYLSKANQAKIISTFWWEDIQPWSGE